MFNLQPWATSATVFVCNCGFWLYCFNRVNSIGLSRTTTKRFEKLVVILCFALPCLILVLDRKILIPWLFDSNTWWPAGAHFFTAWGIFCLISAAILGPPWLESRRWIWPPDNLLTTHSQRFNVGRELQQRGQPVTSGLRTTLLNKIPGNEITHLEVNRKELRLPRTIAGIDGLTIGHISDLHFTGYYSIEFYHFVIDQLLAQQPELIAISGDIIDYSRCLPWIESVLGRLRAPLGCTYVLGNHDKRIVDVREVTCRLDALGHFDAGRGDQWLQRVSGGMIYVAGNELPWFRRQQSELLHEPFDAHYSTQEQTISGPAVMRPLEHTHTLRLGLSHSPDQIVWARRRQLDLLLAGHTHGGQVRIPGLGPLVSPSRFGSRFASGVFYRDPVLMHVSRGVSGTHALRWRCLPEVSLLTLRCNEE